LSVDFYSLV